MAAHTDNSVVINAPLPVVWDITNDVADWPNLFTEYAEAKILECRGNTVRFRLTMHPDENGKKWSWVSERTADPQTHTVTARRVETGFFEYMHIGWYYDVVEGGTRMRWVQDFRMKPQAPSSDEQMERYINANTIKQMAIIKERIEKRHAARETVRTS
jgi:aromatase